MNIKRVFQTQILTFLGGLLLLSAVLTSCSKKKTPLKVSPEPAQTIIDEQGTKDYSIVLNDMDIKEDKTNIIYRHQYIVLQPTADKLNIDSTGWENVSEAFFKKHEKDLGMEVVSQHNGKFSTVVKPVGFDWAVGNEKHGEWVIDSTAKNSHSQTQQQERQWRYHPGSIFLTYWMFSRMTRFGGYGAYANNYRGRAPYYGAKGNTYGTKSNYQKTNRSRFYSRKTGNSSWSTYSKRKASSSRYKGGSSSRGRSGGYGK